MKKIESYVSNDNIIFANENDCIEHEKNVQNFFENVLFFDSSCEKIEPNFFTEPTEGCPIDLMEEIISPIVGEAYYIIIKDTLNLDFAGKFKCDYIDLSKNGFYVFDDEEGSFVDIKEQIKALDDEIQIYQETLSTLKNKIVE